MKLTDTREIIYTSNINKHSICIEIGVHRGINAEKIIKQSPKLLYLVDCWDCRKEYFKEKNIIPHSHGLACNEKQENWYLEVKEKFKNQKNVKIIKNYADNVVTSFEDNYFDFIYIDGLHDYNSVLNDIQKWATKLKNTGIMICDDYVEKEERGYGVIPAIADFLKNNNQYTGQEIKERIFIIKRK